MSQRARLLAVKAWPDLVIDGDSVIGAAFVKAGGRRPGGDGHAGFAVPGQPRYSARVTDGALAIGPIRRGSRATTGAGAAQRISCT